MVTRYVSDASGLIAFFQEDFQAAPGFCGSPRLARSVRVYERVFTGASSCQNPQDLAVVLFVPSVVLVEIYEKWIRTEEFLRRFYWNIFHRLKNSEFVEIRPLDQEILENLIRIRGQLLEHDLHDKIVVATALALDCAIITCDEKIAAYASQCPRIPGVIW